jgi:nitronate monooxygenase
VRLPSMLQRSPLAPLAMLSPNIALWSRDEFDSRRACRGNASQCGSAQEAVAAEAAGADAVIAQGVEAGGHVRGTTPLLELVERVLAVVKVPVLAAGGIVDQQGVREIEAGAVAAVLGTPLSAQRGELRAPRLQAAQPTGRPHGADRAVRLRVAKAPQRVPERRDSPVAWCRPARTGLDQGRQPAHRAAGMRVPEAMQDRAPVPATVLPVPRPGVMAVDDGPRSLLDSGPLYGARTSPA